MVRAGDGRALGFIRLEGLTYRWDFGMFFNA